MSITSGRALEVDIICLVTPAVQNLMMFELDGVNEKVSGGFHSGERGGFVDIGLSGRIPRQKVLHYLVLADVCDEIFAFRRGSLPGRLESRQCVLRKDEPQLLHPLLLVKLQPRLLRNLNLLARTAERPILVVPSTNTHKNLSLLHSG